MIVTPQNQGEKLGNIDAAFNFAVLPVTRSKALCRSLRLTYCNVTRVNDDESQN